MLARLLKLLGVSGGEEDKYIVARSPHDHRKHVFRHEGPMKGFGVDEDLWTSDNGYTFSTQSLVDEQLRGREDE